MVVTYSYLLLKNYCNPTMAIQMYLKGVFFFFFFFLLNLFITIRRDARQNPIVQIMQLNWREALEKKKKEHQTKTKAQPNTTKKGPKRLAKQLANGWLHRKTQMSHLTHLSHTGSEHGQNDSKICKKWVFLSV